MSYWPEPHDLGEIGDELFAVVEYSHEAADAKLALIRAYCVAALTPSCVGEPSPGRDAFAAVVLAMIDGEEGTP